MSGSRASSARSGSSGRGLGGGLPGVQERSVVGDGQVQGIRPDAEPGGDAGCPVGGPPGGHLVGWLAGKVVANPVHPDDRGHDTLLLTGGQARDRQDRRVDPQDHDIVTLSRDKALVGQGQGRDRVGELLLGHRLQGRRVPDPHRPVPGAGDDHLAVLLAEVAALIDALATASPKTMSLCRAASAASPR